MRAIMLAASLFAVPALAQERKVWTPAPVPGNLPSTGAPADRAGSTKDSDNSLPFSSSPTSNQGTNGRTAPTPSGTTSASDVTTPSLSK